MSSIGAGLYPGCVGIGSEGTEGDPDTCDDVTEATDNDSDSGEDDPEGIDDVAA